MTDQTFLGIFITLLIAVLGWMGVHSSQCSKLRERVARLEQQMKDGI